MDGGPNGVHKQNRARGASSVFLFWPFRTLSFPLMSNRCKEKKISYSVGKLYIGTYYYSVTEECINSKV